MLNHRASALVHQALDHRLQTVKTKLGGDCLRSATINCSCLEALLVFFSIIVSDGFQIVLSCDFLWHINLTNGSGEVNKTTAIFRVAISLKEGSRLAISTPPNISFRVTKDKECPQTVKQQLRPVRSEIFGIHHVTDKRSSHSPSEVRTL